MVPHAGEVAWLAVNLHFAQKASQIVLHDGSLIAIKRLQPIDLRSKSTLTICCVKTFNVIVEKGKVILGTLIIYVTSRWLWFGFLIFNLHGQAFEHYHMRLSKSIADGVKNSPDSDFMSPFQNSFKLCRFWSSQIRGDSCLAHPWNKVIRVAYIKIQIEMELGCKIPIVNACNFAHQIKISSFVSAFKFAKLKISNGNDHRCCNEWDTVLQFMIIGRVWVLPGQQHHQFFFFAFKSMECNFWKCWWEYIRKL